VLASVFRGKDGNVEGGLRKESCFFKTVLLFTSRPLRSQKFADLHFEVLKLPAYSPHLAPSDHWHFPNLKKHLKGRKVSSTEEATLAAGRWFAAQQK
jgi:hypothetical protein